MSSLKEKSGKGEGVCAYCTIMLSIDDVFISNGDAPDSIGDIIDSHAIHMLYLSLRSTLYLSMGLVAGFGMLHI